ncbi:MAG: aminoacyl-tRNA hydrolase [Acidobacteria bacterium]|nr:aminoacyl-tRNA hydrolase [Acidobacteriota bacterium]
MYLIAGLGNPGPQYRKSRHNIGFMILDRLAEQHGKKFESIFARSLTCMLEQSGEIVVLAKPQTFMNLSGSALQELLKHYPLDLSQMLIVYDDIDLPLGSIRVRRSGSSGGQKGMESIIQSFGTQIPRLRVGISPGETPLEDYSQFVLSNFTKTERKVVDEMIDLAIEAIRTIIVDGLDRAMSVFNERSKNRLKPVAED